MSLLKKVCMIGAGNFGSAMACVLGKNIVNHPQYDPEVPVWVFEEEVDFQGQSRKLTEVINTEHENVKYLPGFELPHNIVANPDLSEVVADADVLLLVVPGNFLPPVLEDIRTVYEDTDRSKKSVVACSMTKGLNFSEDGPILISEMIDDALGTYLSDTTVLMGANIATDVAAGEFTETTIGYGDSSSFDVLKPLFHCSEFQVQGVEEIAGVELCGALKNIIAMGAGFASALELGPSTYATLLRIGLAEMKDFIQMFFPKCSDDIYFLSCGIADLICTCEGGRNARVAGEFVRRNCVAEDWPVIEKELLSGQKLAGLKTLEEVWEIIEDRELYDTFPMITMIHKIALQNHDPQGICHIYDI